jgi:hypothetical protein
VCDLCSTRAELTEQTCTLRTCPQLPATHTHGMAATGPGLGAYIQAQKRQKQIEDQLAHANKDEGGKDGAKKEDGDKKEDKEEQNTVSSMVKSAAQEVIATVKAVTTPEDPNVRFRHSGISCTNLSHNLQIQACHFAQRTGAHCISA